MQWIGASNLNHKEHRDHSEMILKQSNLTPTLS
jgi:hypothetical protein